MRDIFYLFLILGLCVSLCLSKDVGGTAKVPQNNVVTKNNDANQYEDYDDPLVGANCYTEENHCTSAIDPDIKPICVYKKKIGLTNFLGLCSIKLHDCLVKQQKTLNDGSANQNDEIYYNGKSFDCHYYGARFKSEKQAIIWYFKLGGLDAETQSITQPFENLYTTPFSSRV